jgi:proteasome lid subunit RPN8/RPN11
MTLNDAFEGHSLKTSQFVQKGSLLLLAVLASLILAFRRHNEITLSVLLALSVVVGPAVYLLSRRMVDKVRQRETEQRLMVHTRTYLRNEKPVRPVSPAQESDIEILARAIDGRRLPAQGFRTFQVNAAPLPVGDPVVFDALPRRYAIRSLYERRFADLATALPKPVSLPLSELLMPPAAQEFGSWSAGPGKPSIEYSNAVLDEIRLRAAEGYQRMRHGGVEVGGVLFGARRDGVLRILAARSIECEYLNGPRFVLSKRDETGLAELLLASGSDPELAGMEPAGYYHSHTREEICMSETDMQVFNRFFPRSWQVALVLRPANLAPTRAGFFIRKADGTLGAASGCREFQLS